MIPEPIWAQGSLANTDSLDLVLSLNKAIIEAMTSLNKPWDDLHHRSYFLLELSRIESGEFTLTMTGDRSCPINPLATHEVYAKGNMETITETIPINISKTPRIMENVFVGADCSLEDIQIYKDLFKKFRDVFSWYYEEMPGSKKFEHEITSYPTTIKIEVEKLLKAGFIYPVHLTQWVSNPVLVNRVGKCLIGSVCLSLMEITTVNMA
jgi:hypothetical protein